MGHYNSFMVKIWTEDGGDFVRGYIQHVGTKEGMYFVSWQKMTEFITSHLGWQIDRQVDEELEETLLELHGED